MRGIVKSMLDNLTTATTDVARTNTGCWVLRPAALPAEATMVVTGLGRSGTTMIARVLSELGIFIGASLARRTSEDLDVKKYVKAGDEAGFERFCRLRDAEHPVWGFKNPGFRDHLPLWEKHVRNPRVIFVFRDILAVAQRNHLALNMDLQEALGLAARSYVKALKRLEESQCPALLLSYEKCLADPEFAVARIAEYCGAPLDPERAGAAKAVIKNGDARYFAADA